MPRIYPIPFRRPNGDELRGVFGPVLTTPLGARTRDEIGRELLALAPIGNQFLYHVKYAKKALDAPPPHEDFPTRKAWERETSSLLAKWAKTPEARNTIAWAVTSYYSTIGRFAVKLDGREGIYIPNPNVSMGDKERPLDYVGIGRSEVASQMYRDRVRKADGSSYVPLVATHEHEKGILNLGRWRIPAVQDLETRTAITEAFAQVGTLTSETGLEVSPLSLFYAGEIAVGREVIKTAELFGDKR